MAEVDMQLEDVEQHGLVLDVLDDQVDAVLLDPALEIDDNDVETRVQRIKFLD